MKLLFIKRIKSIKNNFSGIFKKLIKSDKNLEIEKLANTIVESNTIFENKTQPKRLRFFQNGLIRRIHTKRLFRKLLNVGSKTVKVFSNVVGNADFQNGFRFTIGIIGVTQISPALATDGNQKPEKVDRTWKEWRQDVFKFNALASAREVWKNPKSIFTKKNGVRMLYVSAGVTTGVCVYHCYKKLQNSGRLGYYAYRLKTFFDLEETLESIKFKQKMIAMLEELRAKQKMYAAERVGSNFIEKYGKLKPTTPMERVSEAVRDKLIRDIILPEFVKTQNQKK